MKSILLLGFIFLNNVTCGGPVTVYVCNSCNAKKYHYTASCRALRNCKYKIVKTTAALAERKGKTLCGWEIKRKNNPIE